MPGQLLRRAAAAAALLLWVRAARAQLDVQTWPSTAFAPAAAATRSTTPLVNFPAGFVADFSSVRLVGSIACAADDLLLFTITTDGAGAARLWVDDHLILSNASLPSAAASTASTRTLVALRRVPCAAAGAPLPLRLEYQRFAAGAGGTPAQLALLWQGNGTAAPVAPPALVPASALAPLASAPRAQLDALRERLVSPRVPWQTFFKPSMASHVLVPAGLRVAATLGDGVTGELLGDVQVFAFDSPAQSAALAHSRNGSDFTLLTLRAWGARDCDVQLRTTTGGAGDAQLLLLATSEGAACGALRLVVTAVLMPERAGNVSAGANASDAMTIEAALPGFGTTVVRFLVGGAAPAPFPGLAAPHIALPLDAAGGSVGVCAGPAAVSAACPALGDALAAVAAAGQAQAADKARYGRLAVAYDMAASAILWNTVFTPFEQLGVVSPVSRGWDEGLGYVLFGWDNFMVALMSAIEDGALKDLAYANVVALTLSRGFEGNVPNAVSGYVGSWDRTEPPLGARVLLHIYNKWREPWLVELLFDALLRWNQWHWARRRGEGALPDGLIVLGSDPVDGGDRSANTLQGAIYESGLDNSAMYEFANGSRVAFNNETHHVELYDVGMTGVYMSEMAALIELAPVAGRADEVPALQARLDAARAAVQRLWFDEAGEAGAFANAFFDGRPHARLSPTSFFPLIAGAATDAQAAALAVTAASPRFFCMNRSHAPAPGATALVTQWLGGGRDSMACGGVGMDGDCVLAAASAPGTAAFDYVRVEAAVLVPSAGPGPGGLVPLNNFFSELNDDTALTTSEAGPDASYAFVRREGWCFASPPEGGWPILQLRLFYSAAKRDYLTCGSDACVAAAEAPGSGYAPVGAGPLCWAWNATGATNEPCTYGGASIARSDASFADQNYWRGRSWGPHQLLLWWSLKAYDHVPAVRAARLELVAQGLALAEALWTRFAQVPENVNSAIGIPEDSPHGIGADPFYSWGALFGFISFMEDGFV